MSEPIYALSKDIEVFPYTQQSIVYKNSSSGVIITEDAYNNLTNKEGYSPVYHPRDGRVLSEENIALLVSKITNRESYVISENLGANASPRYIEFMLGGRYFKLSEILGSYNILDLSGDGLWVDLSLYDPTALSGYKVMNNTTNTGNESLFGGLEFYKTTPLSATAFQLLDSNHMVPIASRFRLTGSSIQNINGGTV